MPDTHDQPGQPVRALVFSNGALNDGLAVQAALQAARANGNPLVIAADGGARLALECGLVPDVVVGDMDSLTPDELADLQGRGAALERHPPHKDETDLELALGRAAARGATWIRVIGALGGRLDHTLANLQVLLLPDLAGRDVRLVAGPERVWLVGPGTYTIQGAVGDTFSLVPFGGEAVGIRSSGVEYPLHDQSLPPGPARGTSNVLTAPTVQLTLGGGYLLVIHNVGRVE